MKSILSDFPKRVWVKANDKEALTLKEMMDETGESYQFCSKLSLLNVREGKWEKVWKRFGSRPVAAYRKLK